MFFFRFFVVLLYIAFVSSETYCPTIPEIKEDRRSDKGFLRIMQYNVEWLFTDYYKQADCPGNNCTWKNETQAQEHLTQISKVINKLNPDIINLCEVEGCDELNEVIQQTSNTYKSYMIKGTDTSTGQNVGMITKIDPELNLQRTDERVTYPLPFSNCVYDGPENTYGVSKNYISEFSFNNMNVAIIGLHFLAQSDDITRCVKREAQAKVIQNIVSQYIDKKFEVIVIGDFNDYSENPIDVNNNIPISQTLQIVQGEHSENNYKLESVATNIPKNERYTEWWDENGDCQADEDEFSMIDHILITPGLQEKFINAYIYHGYDEYCEKLDSDHYPVILELQL